MLASMKLSKGKQIKSAVLALAAKHGQADAKGHSKQEGLVSHDVKPNKSVHIHQIMNGLKVVLGDHYPAKEAHAKSWKHAAKIGEAYMNGDDTSEMQEDEG